MKSTHFSRVIPSADTGSVCRFVYQVVVPKTLAPKELVAVFESGDKVVLPPWDPMVSRKLMSCVISLSSLQLQGFARLRCCLWSSWTIIIEVIS